MAQIDDDVRTSSPFAARSGVLEWLGTGLRAPSADNVHHVRFRLSGDVVELRADDAYLRCEEDHRRMLMQLSFGAVAENLSLALAAVYRTYAAHWWPDASDPALLLRIDLGHLSAVARRDPLSDALAARHTNRRLFRGPAFTPEEAAAIDGAVMDQGIGLYWYDTPPRRHAVLALMRQAETLRFSDRRLHAELFESIDFDAGWHASAVERLAPATLEVEPPLRGVFAALRHWPVMRTANAIGAARMLGLRAGDLPARLAPHVGVVVAREPGDAAVCAGGAQFQRIWLAANAAGLALQPMVAAAVLTRLDDGARDAAGRRRDAARDGLRSGWQDLLGVERPLVVFRVGRAAHPRIVSSRRPVEDYLVD